MPHRNFRELEAKMDPERIARSKARVEEMIRKCMAHHQHFHGRPQAFACSHSKNRRPGVANQ